MNLFHSHGTNNTPAISICIPVFQTECFLERCLESVAIQKETFTDFEVLVINDCSDGKDAHGRNTKQTVRYLSRKLQLPVRLINHHENRGLVEVRRTAVLNARGMYITQIDSDDLMAPGALAALYKVAVETDADLVHGHSTAGGFINGTFVEAKENRYGTIYYGTIEGHEVFHAWLKGKKYTANIWGKLVKRDLYAAAFDDIPYTQCNMADDVLIFFFLGQKLKKYVGIEAEVYKYIVNTGMSSQRKIDTLQKFRMVCSAASVFTVISTWIDEHRTADGTNQKGETVWHFPLPADEINEIKRMTRYYLYNNILQMRNTVIPELQADARAMLCDYWGESFVIHVEEDIAKMDEEALRKKEAQEAEGCQKTETPEAGVTTEASDVVP